jgi:hypothetical protein
MDRLTVRMIGETMVQIGLGVFVFGVLLAVVAEGIKLAPAWFLLPGAVTLLTRYAMGDATDHDEVNRV